MTIYFLIDKKLYWLNYNEQTIIFNTSSSTNKKLGLVSAQS